MHHESNDQIKPEARSQQFKHIYIMSNQQEQKVPVCEQRVQNSGVRKVVPDEVSKWQELTPKLLKGHVTHTYICTVSYISYILLSHVTYNYIILYNV